MTALKKACLAAVIAAATAGISTSVNAQYVYGAPGYGYGGGGYYAGPGYYDEDIRVVRREPVSPYWGYGGYRTPSRDNACIQERRDFAERTNFICR